MRARARRSGRGQAPPLWDFGSIGGSFSSAPRASSAARQRMSRVWPELSRLCPGRGQWLFSFIHPFLKVFIRRVYLRQVIREYGASELGLFDFFIKYPQRVVGV